MISLGIGFSLRSAGAHPEYWVVAVSMLIAGPLALWGALSRRWTIRMSATRLGILMSAANVAYSIPLENYVSLVFYTTLAGIYSLVHLQLQAQEVRSGG